MKRLSYIEDARCLKVKRPKEIVMHVKERSKRYRVMAENPESKEPLTRPKRTWQNNIKMDLNVFICHYMPLITSV